MTKMYEVEENEKIVEALTQTLEKETGTKVFTMRVLDKKEKEDGFEALVVFEDKTILQTLFSVEPINGKIGIRMRGNYI